MPSPSPSLKPKKPFIGLNEADIKELSSYLRVNILDRSSLLGACLNSRRISVMDTEREPAMSCEIFFETGLMERLYSRCPDKTKFQEWLKETITRQMMAFVGW